MVEFGHTSRRGVGSEIRAVDRAGGRADDQIGTHAVFGERVQHSDLDGSEAAPAGQNERSANLRVVHGAPVCPARVIAAEARIIAEYRQGVCAQRAVVTIDRFGGTFSPYRSIGTRVKIRWRKPRGVQ